MSRQTRHIKASEVRATEEDGNHYVTLRAITPGVVDDYGSVWKPDTFDRALSERLPTLAWGHNWQEPIGRGVSYETGPDGPSIRFRLDDFEAVPKARQAYAQIQSGTLDDCSVGFSNVTRRDPTEDERSAHKGAKEIIEDADLDEVSLVLRGAVPGAKVLQLRAKGETVDSEFVIELARQVAAGDLTQDEAQAAISLAATAADPGPGDEGNTAPPDFSEVEAEIDDVLVARSR